MTRFSIFLISLFAVAPAFGGEASPNTLGQTGLITTPDGQVGPDGEWRIGASFFEPYPALWTSVTVLPRFEFSARFTTVSGVKAGKSDHWDNYGEYKDKAFDAKLQLLKEDTFWPAVSIGTQDFLGTRLFAAEFLAATKNIDDFQLTLGYGTKRLEGVFGGVRYTPSWADNWSFIAEYDNTDYERDKFTRQLGSDQRRGGMTYGIEYRWGWLGAQVMHQDGETGSNFFVSIPLGQREFIPKFQEPAPDTVVVPRVPSTAWQADGVEHVAGLVKALEDQGFRNIKIALEGELLALSLTHGRIARVERAIGRAARTAVLRGPEDMRVLKVTYTENDLPLLTYTFSDLDRLTDHFNGRITQAELQPFIEITSSRPEESERFENAPEYGLEIDRSQEDGTDIEVVVGEGEFFTVRKEEPFLQSWRIAPFNMSLYLNDPSGVVHYNLFAAANYSERIGHARFLNTALRATLLEDVSDVTQKSNSELPHVRSDIAEYTKEGVIKIDKLLINQYLKPAQNVYGRLSAGLYEEMFAGVGGQLLYLPQGNWAVDLTVDWLRQRDVGGTFKFRDYETVTALAGIHYRFPSLGLTTSARIGRFLAKDEGVRYEIKRRFRSGFEFGAWYTVTNGNDTTSPGSPDDPYHDKGLFMSIPLATMLTKDTQAHPDMSIAPWTRDVGQMVRSPGDLYRMLDKRLNLDAQERDPLSFLAQ